MSAIVPTVLGAAAVPAAAVNPTTGVATVAQAPGTATPSFNTTCTVNRKKQNCAQVRAIVQSGDTMYVGGGWAQVTDPTTGTTYSTYKNLVSFNRLTGAIRTGFAQHTFNGMVRAIAVSPNGSTLYVGGEFSKICNGAGAGCVGVQHLVALDANTGAVLAAFTVNGKKVKNPGATNPKARLGRVRALLADATTGRLYVGGDFSKLEGRAVSQLAAIDMASGALVTGFAPTFAIDTTQPNNVPQEVSSLAIDHDPGTAGGARLYAGGHYDYVDGVARNTLVALNPDSGALDNTFKPDIRRQITPYDQNQEGISVLVAPDHTVLLAQGGHYNRGYRFWKGGAQKWMINAGGDLQTVALSGGAVYFGGHFICWSNGTPIYRSDCELKPPPSYTVVRIHLAAVSFDTGALDADWSPLAQPNTYNPYYYGVWVLTVSSAGDLYAGGLFTHIDVGAAQYPHGKLAVFPATS